MQATRVLRIHLSASKGFLVPPRNDWDVLVSAGRACVSLLLNRDNAIDKYKSLASKGIISESVLGQAKMGGAIMLALYHDLESAKHYGFQAEEFLEGVAPALEEFHNVQSSLKNTLSQNSLEEGPTGGEDDKEKEPTADSVSDETAQLNSGSGDAELSKEAVTLAALTGMPINNKRMQHVLKSDWKEQGKKDPDSLAARLAAMVTPEFFDMIQVGSKTTFLVSDPKPYQEDSAQVHNVALLSARAVEMDDTNQDSPDEDSFKVKDDELNVKDNAEIPDDESAKGSVVAQVEVLYDFEETYVVNAKSDDDTAQPPLQGESGTVTRSSLAVGVFEGWLSGDPSGDRELRWKLAMNRPAWEFPAHL